MITLEQIERLEEQQSRTELALTRALAYITLTQIRQTSPETLASAYQDFRTALAEMRREA